MLRRPRSRRRDLESAVNNRRLTQTVREHKRILCSVSSVGKKVGSPLERAVPDGGVLNGILWYKLCLPSCLPTKTCHFGKQNQTICGNEVSWMVQGKTLPDDIIACSKLFKNE